MIVLEILIGNAKRKKNNATPESHYAYKGYLLKSQNLKQNIHLFST